MPNSQRTAARRLRGLCPIEDLLAPFDPTAPSNTDASSPLPRNDNTTPKPEFLIYRIVYEFKDPGDPSKTCSQLGLTTDKHHLNYCRYMKTTTVDPIACKNKQELFEHKKAQCWKAKRQYGNLRDPAFPNEPSSAEKRMWWYAFNLGRVDRDGTSTVENFMSLGCKQYVSNKD